MFCLFSITNVAQMSSKKYCTPIKGMYTFKRRKKNIGKLYERETNPFQIFHDKIPLLPFDTYSLCYILIKIHVHDWKKMHWMASVHAICFINKGTMVLKLHFLDN